MLDDALVKHGTRVIGGMIVSAGELDVRLGDDGVGRQEAGDISQALRVALRQGNRCCFVLVVSCG